MYIVDVSNLLNDKDFKMVSENGETVVEMYINVLDNMNNTIVDDTVSVARKTHMEIPLYIGNIRFYLVADESGVVKQLDIRVPVNSGSAHEVYPYFGIYDMSSVSGVDEMDVIPKLFESDAEVEWNYEHDYETRDYLTGKLIESIEKLVVGKYLDEAVSSLEKVSRDGVIYTDNISIAYHVQCRIGEDKWAGIKRRLNGSSLLL